MDLIRRAQVQVQTVWHRAEYIARTEGTAAMVRRMAESAGLREPRRPAPEPPAVPATPVSEESAAAWPDSVLVLSSGGPRIAQFAALDLPVLVRPAGAADLHAAQQLVAVVYILGQANWRDGVLAQARRLRQPVVLEPAAHETPDPRLLACCDAVVLDAARSLPPAVDPVIIPTGGGGLETFLSTLRGRR